jgi:hypothetical protein
VVHSAEVVSEAAAIAAVHSAVVAEVVATEASAMVVVTADTVDADKKTLQ